VTAAQRWQDRRASYRPADDERFNPADFEVADIPDDVTAKAFVLRHHYSGSYPAARRRYGLYRRGGELAGVMVLSQPVSNATLAKLPGEPTERAELGRLVLLEDVKRNGESWFAARCFELARASGIVSLVSFSDPVPRTTLDGRTVHRGHVGTIYQASNAVYTGRGDARTLHILPDGSVFNHRAEMKLRRMERGWEHVLRQLQGHGAGEWTGDGLAYLTTWLPRVTRRLKHGGNHRYLFGLDRRARKHLPASLPYPKKQLEGLFVGTA
jgi:hypothetical protein